MDPDAADVRTSALFAHHPRTFQDHRYVYPVVSRRSRGLSVGIIVLPVSTAPTG